MTYETFSTKMIRDIKRKLTQHSINHVVSTFKEELSQLFACNYQPKEKEIIDENLQKFWGFANISICC